MNEKSRSSNSIRNMSVSIGMQVLLLLTSFAGRTIFIKILGEQYLGISGLYTNILSVLSLADLGITTVMIYALYRPIATNDKKQIAILVGYFKKLYRYIALSVFVLGLMFVPFLQYIIKDSTLPLDKLRLFFLLYLINTVCSYLIVYKTTMINADQRIYIIKMVDFFATMLLYILQIVVLAFTHNFVFYLITNIFITLAKNMVMSVITNKYYPFLKEKTNLKVSPEIKIKLKDNIKSIFLYKVSATIMNSTDSILISIILGTVVVGQYSNYLLITTAITTFILLVTQSLLASLGNFIVTETAERKLLIMRCLLLIYYGIATFCACCFVSMFNDFINLWIGGINHNYILSEFTVYAITFNFYVNCVLNPIWMFRESAGLFKQVKYSMTFAAIINIVLSIILGKLLGVAGIVVATAISKLVTNFWFEPKILFREIFKSSTKKYWLYILKLFCISLPCIIITALIGGFLPNTILFIILKILISCIITCVAFILFNANTKEYLYIKTTMLNIRSNKKLKNDSLHK